MTSEELLAAIGEVDDDAVEDAHTRLLRPRMPWKPILSAAAVLLLACGLRYTFLPHQTPQMEPILRISASEPSPDGMRKFLNYNGHRYAFLYDGSTYQISEEQLTESLGQLQYEISADPKADFAATFALGGTLYAVRNYHPDFRIAVELDGQYYLCENVDSTDGTELDPAAYFETAALPENIASFTVCDHFGETVLLSGSSADASVLFAAFAEAEPVVLSEALFSSIAQAQNQGLSYQLIFRLLDATDYRIYVIPSLSLVMIGDSRYTLPDSFLSDCGAYFPAQHTDASPMQ